MKILMDQRKDFFKKTLSIALPVMIQNLLSNSLSFVDTLMIGQLGEQSIAAVGLGNQMFFLISLLFFGISSGSSIFLSQYWGSRNLDGIQKILGLSLTFAFLGALIFSLASCIVPRSIMHVFTYDEAVVSIGATYLRIVAFSYIASSISQILATALRVIGKAKTPLAVAVISLATNVLGNYLLIFGIGPFPALGVAGAALATAFSRILETVLLLFFVYKKYPMVSIQSKTAFKWSKPFLSRIVPTCMPVIANEFFWALGMTVYKVAYSKMGVDAIAAVNVTESIANMFFVAMIGLSNATVILIGIKIGERKEDLARLYAKRFILITFCTGIFAGLLEVGFAPTFTRLFNISLSVQTMALYCLYANAVLLPIKSMNMSIIVGILRAGGDTRYSMFSEMFGVWCVGVPLAFIGSMIFHLSIWNLYLLLGMEEVSKFIIGFLRVHSGKWIHDLTEKPSLT
ncbi:MATE family efflux transporter [uncultured Sphaerochaeta sp.]|uniref:MATE family efflux transporter n=1 Tax=uncultured Sphaerochaeta sp. TaxID=886478 RepID=UPI002A0A3CBD|nr:MATE family efflux transporter [uncultured Sphaerochaeta sp.]